VEDLNCHITKYGVKVPAENIKSLGSLIKKERKNKGLSQKQLAEKIGTTNTHISKWERDLNVPGGENMVKLARILAISPEILKRQKRVDKINELSLTSEPDAIYGDDLEECIKNLETTRNIIDLTINKLKNLNKNLQKHATEDVD
jgi:transcriptional regulator with XRE-family HTH domain